MSESEPANQPVSMNFSWLIILMAIFLVNTAHAEKIRYVIGVQDFEHYLPYSTVTNGEYLGFNRELFDHFAETTGYQFEYRAYPIKRLYLAFTDGQVDFKYPDNPYWSANIKKKLTIIYSQPVTDYTDGVMVRPENMTMSLKEIRTLGIPAGFTPLPFALDTQGTNPEIVEVFGYEKLIRQTLSGTLDGAYSNIQVSRYFLDKVLSMPGALVFNPGLPSVTSQRSLSSIQHPGVIIQFNQFLRKEAKAIDALKQKHGLD